ncbi:MAG: aminotransferase class V-fold PLP-dependent enzyme [Polyangiaceae bacterium]
MILLNPGPVTMSHGVRAALAVEDVCHREPEFLGLVADVRRRLVAVYGDPDTEGVLLGGSGTAAVESMLSLARRDRPTVVVANGVYGERMAAMLASQGKPHVVVPHPWTSAVDLARVETAIAREKPAHVAVVHHETTTGRKNALAPLGALARAAGASLLVDAVSSFGCEEIRFAPWNVDAVAATANKCLHGAPGVSFVVARKDVLEGPCFPTTLYLDLGRLAAIQRRGDLAFTLPTHVTFALQQALVELTADGGVEGRRATYLARASVVRRALVDSGVSPLLGDDTGAAALAAYALPEGTTWSEVHDGLRADGFVAYAGQGPLATTTFRVAVMGSMGSGDLARLDASLRRVFARAGVRT